MPEFARQLKRSWIVSRFRALRWYYLRRLGWARGGAGVRLAVRRPGMAGPPRTIPWRTMDDARESLRMFSDSNPWLRTPLPETPATVVDLGANVGFSLLFWALRYPAARIVAVEMDADNADRCREVAALNGLNAEVVCAAASDTDGTLNYRRHGSHTRHALANIAPAAGESDATEAVAVPTVTLPTLFDRLGLSTVDLLKVDIEGAEEHLLRGIAAWAPRVKAMLIELHHNIVEADARAALASAGFRIVVEDHADRTELYCERP